MKLLSILALGAIFALTSINMYAQKVYDISTFGLKPDTHKNASPVLQKALSKIKAECKDGEAVILRFSEGRYDFHEKKKELPYANIISRTMTKTILRK